MLKKIVFGGWCLVALAGGLAPALEPVNPELIPEARRVLDYLESVYGKKTLSGVSSYGGWRPIKEMSGRTPAIYATDACGWNPPKWGQSYRNNLQHEIDSTGKWWHEKGGIPSMQFHWGKPGDPNGSAWVGGDKGTGAVDVKKTVTPGTPEHKAAMEDLRLTADYLEQLAKARVPVLWRPYHEIDGGWFWWTDGAHPEDTAALWRMTFDYLVKERKLHNLIWVYSAGLKPAGLKRDADLAAEIAHRKRFYPGAQYVDIAGIDIYPSEYHGWGPATTDTYGKAFEIMQQVAPGKLLALCEGAAIPNPDLLQKQGPGWLYSLPWFTSGQNPAEWIRQTYTHEHILTLDELPALTPHNVAPRARLEEPANGAAVAGSTVGIQVRAADCDDNLDHVEYFLLPGTWKNWALRKDEEIQEALLQAKRLGAAKLAADGRCAFEWTDAPAGLHDLVAVARDKDGAAGVSNVVRLTVGVKNLARGAKVSASSDAGREANGVDGDPFTAWSGAKEGPQWLAVDLGAAQTVGGVVVSWWKAYAKAYQIQVSTDGENWQEVFREDNKKIWHGDSDVIRFEPTQARHVRLYCTQRGVDWGGYTVYEFAVFPSIPK